MSLASSTLGQRAGEAERQNVSSTMTFLFAVDEPRSIMYVTGHHQWVIFLIIVIALIPVRTVQLYRYEQGLKRAHEGLLAHDPCSYL